MASMQTNLIKNIEKLCITVFARHLSSTALSYRSRSEWRNDRKPANTKLGETDIIEERKAYGGRKKLKAIQISKGIFSLPSQNFEETLQIVDVVHSDAGKHYREQKIIAKGTIVKVDISRFAELLNLDSLCDEENNSVKKTAYAEIMTRPGQVGACNGLILEKGQLNHLFEKLRMYKEVNHSVES